MTTLQQNTATLDWPVYRQEFSQVTAVSTYSTSAELDKGVESTYGL